MKTRLEIHDEIFQKQKKIAIEINKEFSGTIVINVEPFFDNLGTKEPELYIDSIRNILPDKIEVYTFNDIDNNLRAEFNLGHFEDNNRSQDVIHRLKLLLMNNGCKTL